MQRYFTVKAAETKLVEKDAGGITRMDIRAANCILGPAIDIRAIGDLPARWLLKPTALSEMIQNLIQGGQLPYSGERLTPMNVWWLGTWVRRQVVTKFVVSARNAEHVLVLGPRSCHLDHPVSISHGANRLLLG